MNASRFDSIVNNRAIERVTQKLTCFRSDIIAAIQKLDGTQFPNFSPAYKQNNHGWWPDHIDGDLKFILNNIAKGLTFDERGTLSEYPRLKWPKSLFDRERELVENELLRTMDEMQKALAAPSPNPDSVIELLQT